MCKFDIHLVCNYKLDLSQEEWKYLAELIDILANELPKLERKYITGMAMNPVYSSMIINKHSKVLGGLIFRIFPKLKFAELSMLATSITHRNKGYGSMLMDQLKDYLVSQNIEHILAYADDGTLDFYRRVGFTSHVTMPASSIEQCVSCSNSTLMQCTLVHSISYVHARDVLKQQLEVVNQVIRDNCFSLPLSGLTVPAQAPRQQPLRNQVFLEKLGFKVTSYQDQTIELKPKLNSILEQLYKSEYGQLLSGKSKPRDYWNVIDSAKYIDLSMMKAKLDRGYYASLYLFNCDMAWCVESITNHFDRDTLQHQSALKAQQFYLDLLEKLELVPVHT